MNRGPKHYQSFADFEREELHRLKKIGFSLDDLEYEASYRPGREYEQDDPDELDFG